MQVRDHHQVDALFIYLSEKVHQPATRQRDEDIALDFDVKGRLVAIEVLDASKRADLACVLPCSKRKLAANR